MYSFIHSFIHSFISLNTAFIKWWKTGVLIYNRSKIAAHLDTQTAHLTILIGSPSIEICSPADSRSQIKVQWSSNISELSNFRMCFISVLPSISWELDKSRRLWLWFSACVPRDWVLNSWLVFVVNIGTFICCGYRYSNSWWTPHQGFIWFLDKCPN